MVAVGMDIMVKCGNRYRAVIKFWALFSTLVANLLLYGWILSTTGNFTHSIKEKSSILICNKCYGLCPLKTAQILLKHVCYYPGDLAMSSTTAQKYEYIKIATPKLSYQKLCLLSWHPVILHCVYWNWGHPDNGNQSEGRTETIDSNIFKSSQSNVQYKTLKYLNLFVDRWCLQDYGVDPMSSSNR